MNRFAFALTIMALGALAYPIYLTGSAAKPPSGPIGSNGCPAGEYGNKAYNPDGTLIIMPGLCLTRCPRKGEDVLSGYCIPNPPGGKNPASPFTADGSSGSHNCFPGQGKFKYQTHATPPVGHPGKSKTC